ncbi:TPA: hypothetical protein ACN12S_002881, partial [Staphylococcus aureus]
MLYLKNQWIKTKRTSIKAIVFLTPILFITIFTVLSYLGKQMNFEIFRVSSLQLFFQVGFPFAITLIIGLLFRIERKNKAFQNTVIYFSSLKKYYVTNFIFFVMLGFLMIIISYILLTFYYWIITHGMDFLTLSHIYVYIVALITSIPIISFLYFLNIIFNSFLSSAIISFLFIIGNFFVGVMGIHLSYVYFYSYLVFSLYNGYNNIFLIISSIVYTCIFLYLGYLK